MTAPDNSCPWCGETLTNPFTGKDAPPPGDRVGEYDLALEAHVPECEPFLTEMGAGLDWDV